MNKTLLIGIGQIGCTIADTFARTSRPEDGPVHVLAIDTDARTEEAITSASSVIMASPCKISDVLNEVDTDLVKQWFPCDRENDCIEYFESMSVHEGANQWRMKALLTFYHFLSNPKNRALLEKSLLAAVDPETKDLRIFVIASLAGGTGSGLFFPLTLYVKNLFRSKAGLKNIDVNAFLTLPDFCEELLTAEQQVKARANAYAALREINAITNVALGKEPSFSFRIGSEEDSVFGLLYDAKNPDFQTPENVPFRQITLVRRMPGIRSLLSRILFLADTVRTACMEPPSMLQPTDALYSGISLTKTLYPAEDIVSYISQADFCRHANADWFYFYKTAETQRRQIPAAGLDTDVTPDKNPYNIAVAVREAVKTLCPNKESYSVLLNRNYETFEEDDAPEILLPEDFQPRLDQEIRRGPFTEEAYELDRFIQDYKDLKKKKKQPRISRKERTKNLSRAATSCGILLKNYFIAGTRFLTEMKKKSEILFDSESNVSLRQLLQHHETTLHPSYALARLSAAYLNLKNRIQESDKRTEAFLVEKPEEHLPYWLFSVDESAHTNSRYSQAGADRLARIVKGDLQHVGGKQEDETLFYYDVEVAYQRIARALRAEYAEELLHRIGEWIVFYKSAFEALTETMTDRNSELDTALHRASERSGSVYYVGAATERKKYLYEKFLESLEDSDLPRSLQKQTDAELGETFLRTAEEQVPTEIKLRERTDALADKICAALHEAYCKTAFYQDLQNKSVLEVILSQDGKFGTDRSELALSRSFASSNEPLIYVIPNTNNPYSLSRNICKSVIAYLPATSEEYLKQHAEDFHGQSPCQILESLLFRAGEYEEMARFTNAMPSNELRVVRKTEGLKLSFLEIFNESSYDPQGYKAYLKALHMEQEQCTALWNPHLICGIKDETLPRISES